MLDIVYQNATHGRAAGAETEVIPLYGIDPEKSLFAESRLSSESLFITIDYLHGNYAQTAQSEGPTSGQTAQQGQKTLLLLRR